MDIMSLVDRMEEMVTEGRRIPMTNSVVVGEQDIYDIIDEIRSALPDELKQARWIIKERKEMIEEAEKEANRLIEEAKRKAEEAASDTEIVQLAQKKANELLEEAQAKEREIRLGAEDYADEMLANLEVNLGKLLTAVQRGRDRLQGKMEK